MIIRECNREELARNIRSGYPLAGNVHLQFGNCHILVQSNSELVINGLKLYFSARCSNRPVFRRQQYYMKFTMNGALTIETLDGANVEIREAVGEVFCS